MHSHPEGAEIYMKGYRAIDRPWEYAGRSPIEHLKVPFGVLRWKAEKQGFETAEVLSFSIRQLKSLTEVKVVTESGTTSATKSRR